MFYCILLFIISEYILLHWVIIIVASGRTDGSIVFLLMGKRKFMNLLVVLFYA